MLDTRKDITRRKGLAMAAYNKMKHILENQHISTDIKMRIFNAYVSSIFLFNSELWTITQALNHEIDVFQRILLGKIMKIKWQDHISNENLYTMTNQHPWSKTIKKRRFSWFGHLTRLPVETPVRKALTEFRRPVREPKGKQKTTWYQMMKKELHAIEVDIDVEVENLGGGGGGNITQYTQNRITWKTLMSRAMSF